jgi:UDP-N-acetylmuramyl tripeptide synthase
MQIKDSRRLTGANLQSPLPSALADIVFEADEDRDSCLKAWRAALARILPHFALTQAHMFERLHAQGASLGFSAPVDQLYAATEINEWAIHAANSTINNMTEPSLDEAILTIRRTHAEEQNTSLMALKNIAEERACPFLWDDDQVSLGFGRHSQTWPADDLPSAEEIDWAAAQTIPLALITGTNGKTTTSRMLTRILKTAGFCVGSTSTDGLSVNEKLIESGDWTGTGAARAILRDKRVDAAVLETARGGILRRGLAVERCDVAVVTNVASDHLGDYGIDDVAAMAEVKSLICSAVDGRGKRVINADDPRLCALLERYDSPLVLYSLDSANPLIATHCDAGGEAWLLVDGRLTQRCGALDHPVIAAKEIPCAIDGAAHHNLSNALAASAAASAIGVTHSLIAKALCGFGARPEDNPGRCQLVELGGVQILLDFGHNPHGMRAVLGMANRMLKERPSARLCVSVGQAGDRSDEDIRALGRTLVELGTHKLILRELHEYTRGRPRGEASQLIAKEAWQAGMDPRQVSVCEGEVVALSQALDWALPGDLIVLLVHVERGPVMDWLQSQQSLS